MQLTAQLKPISELKSLPTFKKEYKGHLGFKDNINITPNMLSKSSITLTYNKDWKAWSDGTYEYSLDWLTNITISDEKLKLSLEINDLTLTVRILEMDESLRNRDFNGGKIYKSHKDKFRVASDVYLAIYQSSLFIHGTSKDKEFSSRKFESMKVLSKWIRNLLKVKHNQPKTLTPSQLWTALESGAYPPNSLFRDQDGNIFIFTGKSLQVHETDEEDNVYVGLCVGDKLEFIGVLDECMTFENGIEVEVV